MVASLSPSTTSNDSYNIPCAGILRKERLLMEAQKRRRAQELGQLVRYELQEIAREQKLQQATKIGEYRQLHLQQVLLDREQKLEEKRLKKDREIRDRKRREGAMVRAQQAVEAQRIRREEEAEKQRVSLLKQKAGEAEEIRAYRGDLLVEKQRQCIVRQEEALRLKNLALQRKEAVQQIRLHHARDERQRKLDAKREAAKARANAAKEQHMAVLAQRRMEEEARRVKIQEQEELAAERSAQIRQIKNEALAAQFAAQAPVQEAHTRKIQEVLTSHAARQEETARTLMEKLEAKEEAARVAKARKIQEISQKVEQAQERMEKGRQRVAENRFYEEQQRAAIAQSIQATREVLINAEAEKHLLAAARRKKASEAAAARIELRAKFRSVINQRMPGEPLDLKKVASALQASLEDEDAPALFMSPRPPPLPVRYTSQSRSAPPGGRRKVTPTGESTLQLSPGSEKTETDHAADPESTNELQQKEEKNEHLAPKHEPITRKDSDRSYDSTALHVTSLRLMHALEQEQIAEARREREASLHAVAGRETAAQKQEREKKWANERAESSRYILELTNQCQEAVGGLPRNTSRGPQ